MASNQIIPLDKINKHDFMDLTLNHQHILETRAETDMVKWEFIITLISSVVKVIVKAINPLVKFKGGNS